MIGTIMIKLKYTDTEGNLHNGENDPCNFSVILSPNWTLDLLGLLWVLDWA